MTVDGGTQQRRNWLRAALKSSAGHAAILLREAPKDTVTGEILAHILAAQDAMKRLK